MILTCVPSAYWHRVPYSRVAILVHHLAGNLYDVILVDCAASCILEFIAAMQYTGPRLCLTADPRSRRAFPHGSIDEKHPSWLSHMHIASTLQVIQRHYASIQSTLVVRRMITRLHAV